MTQTQDRPVTKRTAREYLQALRDAGAIPDGERPTFEQAIDDIVCELENSTRSGNKRRLQHDIDTYIKNVPAFAAFFKETFEKAHTENSHEQNDEPIMPPLEWGLLPKELGQGVSSWFDECIAFSKKWSPRACDIQHKGAAAFILSTIAIGRIAAEYGGLQYTPLYIALVAPSTVFAKTTTVKTATDILSRAGFDWTLGSNSITPEKLLSNMGGKFIPGNWDKLSDEEKEAEEKRLAYSGQLGWYYSEFGQLIREMSDDKGRNSAFKALLQRMDDGEDHYSYETHKRGKENISHPYLAFLGTMTPDCMKPYSGSDASSWGDGTYARFAFCCPPANKKKTREMLKAERFPDETKTYPTHLLKALQEWEKRLPQQYAHVVTRTDEKGNDADYDIVREPEIPPGPIIYKLGRSVKAALDEYGDALSILAQEPELKQFQSSYGRLAIKALRIATLIASLENSMVGNVPTIQLSHLAFAQGITEEIRESLHHVDAFLHQNNAADERAKIEDGIIAYLAGCKEPKKAGDVRLSSRAWRQIDPDSFKKIIINLVKEGTIQSARKPGERVDKYEVAK